jgi:DNA-binding MarR family transcriptional regulator
MTVTDPEIPQRPVPGPPKELLSSSSFLLKRLGFLLKERGFAAFEAIGLSPYHHAVLALLEEQPPETQAMIADALGYDRSHLVGILDELEERGLVERKRDPADRRRHLVSVTANGKRTLGRMRDLVGRMEDEFFAPLEVDQRETLHALLLELASHHDVRYSMKGHVKPQ